MLGGHASGVSVSSAVIEVLFKYDGQQRTSFVTVDINASLMIDK